MSALRYYRFWTLFFLFLIVSGETNHVGLRAEENQDSVEREEKIFGDDNPFTEQPLYLGMPYNCLVLTSHYNGARFNVMPIEFPTGRPDPLPRFGEISIRFIENPHKEFQVKWNFVERIELFHELVLEEYRQRLDYLVDKVRKGNSEDEDWNVFSEYFESLFDYLRFLEDYKKELPDLTEAYRKFLFEEAVYRIKGKDYLTGLTRFASLFQADRNYPGLERAAAGAMNLALSQLDEAGEYVKCRQRLEGFAPYLSQHQVFLDWQHKLNERANKFFEQAKEAETSNDYFHAHQNIDEALKINPDSAEFSEWQNSLQKRFPRFSVAVDIPLSGEEDFVSLPNWGRQRGRRLFRQMLCEYDRPGLDGNVYHFSLGTINKPVGNSRQIELVFNNDSTSNRNQTDFYDVVETLERLRSFCQTKNFLFSFSLNPILTEDSFSRLILQLDRPFPLPESLLVVPLLVSSRFRTDMELSSESENPVSIQWKKGIYDLLPQNENLNVLVARSKNGKKQDGPSVLLEKTVLRPEEAVEQLLAGKIDMIDRLAPWETERLTKSPNVAVGRYVVPTVHFIVPNHHKPLTASRTFRRALLYGLNRNGMLARLLEKGGEGIVSSVPFVRGRSLGDPLGYACDPSIRPRPYEPKLAIALVLSAFNQMRNREPGWDERTAMPELVLARPEHERAEYVALLIRRQWAAIGVPVRIIVYKDEKTIGRDDKIDFWLVERNVREPLIDASKIFDSDGLCGKASPYMELALEKLHESEDWPTAAVRLQEIHRLCYDEVSVLPLWQLVEYYACRADLSGVSDENGLVDLYQHVSGWREQERP